MHPRGQRRRFVPPDNNEILRRRYGGKERPSHHRVILGRYAFIKGWLVAVGAWFAISLVLSIIDQLSSPNSAALNFWGLMLTIGLFFAAALGAPFALLLGMLLRPVRRQWVHVLAFAAGLAALTWGTVALLAPGTGPLPAVLAAIAGTAAGIGRAAVIRDVDVYDDGAALGISEDRRRPGPTEGFAPGSGC